MFATISRLFEPTATVPSPETSRETITKMINSRNAYYGLSTSESVKDDTTTNDESLSTILDSVNALKEKMKGVEGVDAVAKLLHTTIDTLLKDTVKYEETKSIEPMEQTPVVTLTTTTEVSESQTPNTSIVDLSEYAGSKMYTMYKLGNDTDTEPIARRVQTSGTVSLYPDNMVVLSDVSAVEFAHIEELHYGTIRECNVYMDRVVGYGDSQLCVIVAHHTNGNVIMHAIDPDHPEHDQRDYLLNNPPFTMITQPVVRTTPTVRLETPMDTPPVLRSSEEPEVPVETVGTVSEKRPVRIDDNNMSDMPNMTMMDLGEDNILIPKTKTRK